jgi:butyryl-CoA dehydrogenase
MGWRSSSTRELSFEDCRVPSSHLLFKSDTNLTSLIRDMYLGRISLAASSIGLGQACYDHSLKYAQERVQFGKPISKFQRVQDMLVDMHVELEAAKMLNYKAGFLRDQGEYSAAHTAASVAKYYGTEAAKRAADRAVQIHGGYGFMDEYPVSRYYRDIRVATIGDGTSEIQRSIIAKSLGC